MRPRKNLQTLAQAAERIRKRVLSPLDLVRESLDAIDELNPRLNAFITVTAEAAIADARKADEEIRGGNWRGPLHGIPVGLKDLIDTAGVRTTAASAVFKDRVPTRDAEIVERLKASGAIIVGKQNLHEFAYGGSSLVSHFGPVRNPVNPEFIAGGSSGGSSAAVAAGMCYAAIGTDTAGSIREPAALCGVVGLKPSYGVVSTEGIIPLSISLDHAGPITRTVRDAAIVLDALRGRDRTRDLDAGIGGLALGIPRKFFFEGLDREISAAVEEAIRQLGKAAKAVREVDFPVDEDRTVFLAESRAYHRDKVERCPELYDPETLRRLKSGDPVTAGEHRQAIRRLEKARRDSAEIFRDVDLVLTPTTPVPAPRIADLFEDISRLRPAELVLLRNTRPANVCGLPAISVPCGSTARGLPIGLQIIGPQHGEENVLRAARVYERLNRLPA
ncbi:MAG: amidase [Acidobacteria bacterium]|nr:amidase [Acidobacteriota bacterium]